MPDVHNSPEALRAMASTLQQCASELEAEERKLRAALGRFREVARDAKYARFEERFRTTLAWLTKWRQEADGAITQLRRDAGILDRYMRR